MDNQIRAMARMKLQRLMPHYFWGCSSAIKIVANNGDIILIGVVTREGDKNTAEVQCKSVPGSFHVFKMLTVQEPARMKKA